MPRLKAIPLQPKFDGERWPWPLNFKPRAAEKSGSWLKAQISNLLRGPQDSAASSEDSEQFLQVEIVAFSSAMPPATHQIPENRQEHPSLPNQSGSLSSDPAPGAAGAEIFLDSGRRISTTKQATLPAPKQRLLG
jgi:hypothetical protein